jgi:hypothetical protein
MLAVGFQFGSIIVGLALLLNAFGVIYGGQRMSQLADDANTRRDVFGTLLHKVEQIDTAVNGKPPGGQSMVSQVQDMHDEKFPDQKLPEPAILPLVTKLASQVEAIQAKLDALS